MSSLWSRKHNLLKDLMKIDRDTEEEQQRLRGDQTKTLFVRAERATEAGDWCQELGQNSEDTTKSKQEVT